MRFEWDRHKAAANLRKHGLTFEEATSVFGDPLSLTIADPKHPAEERWVTVGQSHHQRTIVVVHADLPDGVRVISARLATKRERKAYEEGSQR